MKKLLSLVLSIVMCLSIFAFAACGDNETPPPEIPPTPERVDLLRDPDGVWNWVDDNKAALPSATAPFGSQAAYTITEIGGNQLALVDSHKLETTNTISKTLAPVTSAGYDVKEFTKLIITAKGANHLAINFVSTFAIPGGKDFDTMLVPLTSNYETYEFDLSPEYYWIIRQTMSKIILTPNSGLIDGQESLSISQLELSTAPVVKTRALNKLAPAFLAVDGTEAEASILGGIWESNAPAMYTIEKTDNSVKITTVNKSGWNRIGVKFAGNLAEYKSIRIKFKGIVKDPKINLKCVKLNQTGGTGQLESQDTGAAPDAGRPQISPIIDGTEQTFVFSLKHMPFVTGMAELAFYLNANAASNGEWVEFYEITLLKTEVANADLDFKG